MAEEEWIQREVESKRERERECVCLCSDIDREDGGCKYHSSKKNEKK